MGVKLEQCSSKHLCLARLLVTTKSSTSLFHEDLKHGGWSPPFLLELGSEDNTPQVHHDAQRQRGTEIYGLERFL